MNDKFDELAKGLAQSVTRRAALKKFGVGLAGIVLAVLGLANKTEARGRGKCVQWSACCDGCGVVYTCGQKPPGCRIKTIVDCAICRQNGVICC